MTVKWINPITNEEDVLIIERPFVDANFWYHSVNCITDKDITKVLDDIINNIDCTKEYNCGRPMMTTFFNYKKHISNYYYYLLKIRNQFIYNEYINKLIDRHSKNIFFEYFYPYKPIKVGKSKRNSKNRTIKNTFIKSTSFDMFTKEPVYFYDNPKTGERYKTNNPNLLKKINKNKRKEKHTKCGAVPISAMTFSFNKKK